MGFRDVAQVNVKFVVEQWKFRRQHGQWHVPVGGHVSGRYCSVDGTYVFNVTHNKEALSRGDGGVGVGENGMSQTE